MNRVCLFLLAAAGTTASTASAVKVSTALLPADLHLILSADDGTYSGTHEQKYILERTTIVQNLTSIAPFCQSALLGSITVTDSNENSLRYFSKKGSASTVNALLVTSGIGSVTAALCTQQITSWAVSNSPTPSTPFVAAYFMGTSGWSPFIGGLNPRATGDAAANCDAARSSNPIQQRISVGSVCVSPVSFDFECGFHKENPLAQGKAGECYDLGYDGSWGRTDLFGTCAYNSIKGGGQQLAESILDATQQQAAAPINKPLPSMPDALKGYATNFWSDMALGRNSTNFSVPTTPIVISRCAEAVSHAIWVGAEEDFQCRLLTGKLLSAGGLLEKKSSSSTSSSGADRIISGSDGTVTSFTALGDDQDMFVCTSAMEGYGFLSAFTRQFPAIPAVIIRGASNYDMYPLYQFKPEGSSDLLWLQNEEYVPSDVELAFSTAGYQYAIHTSNEVLLNYLTSTV